MVTSKALKAGFLLWAFAAGLSAASSTFQDKTKPTAGSFPFIASYQIPQPDHANDPPAGYYQNPPANEPPEVSSSPPTYHADNPPPVSYQNSPSIKANPPSSCGSITPPFDHWHEHHHHLPEQKPPTNCDIPPANGYNNPTPPPSTGYNTEPPSSGGGGGDQSGYGPIGSVEAPSPIENDNPTPPSGYHYYPPGPSTDTPSTPPNANTPSTMPYAGAPSTTPPDTGNTSLSPPYFLHKPIFGGTSDFWKTHHPLMMDILKWWHATIGRGSNIPMSNMNFQEALSNTRTDGIGELYREGTASLLNSMVNKDFPFTTREVWNSFSDALHSNKAAGAQAEVFKLANKGRLKPRV